MHNCVKAERAEVLVPWKQKRGIKDADGGKARQREGEGGKNEMAGRQTQRPVSHHRAVFLRLIVLDEVMANHESFGVSQHIIVSQKQYRCERNIWGNFMFKYAYFTRWVHNTGLSKKALMQYLFYIYADFDVCVCSEKEKKGIQHLYFRVA